MPLLVVSPVVTIEIPVTSEPVPAVVGISASGKRSPWTWSMPYIELKVCEERASTATNLATSSEDPPPSPTTTSAAKARAFATASMTTWSGGSACTSSHTRTVQPRCFSESSAGAIKPLLTRNLSVTSTSRPIGKRSARISPSRLAAPLATVICGTVLKR